MRCGNYPPCYSVSILLVICMTHLNSGFSQDKTGKSDSVQKIHENVVFADMHAHPDIFHRANIPRISQEELNRYRRSLMDLVVCCISTDAAYQGGYVRRDGTTIDRLPTGRDYKIQPGDAFAFTQDRLLRILRTVEEGEAVLALSPSGLLKAKAQDHLAIMAALEGADGLEGDIENLRKLHGQGLRLLQLVHFRANELGYIQTRPYRAGGLTPFGREVIRECNRLGIVIDLAHAHKQTTMNAVELSEHPVIFSHTGVKALHDGDRYLSDEEIRTIAGKGGIIGIWPSSSFGTMETMVEHIDYVKKLAGIDHVGIGSDFRGMRMLPAFGDEANFMAIAEALLDYGYSDQEVGKVMGGNFLRLWKIVAN